MAVYLEAVHTVHPLTSRVFDRYVELYGEFVVPKLAEHGLELLGAWKRTGGTTGQDLLLLRFDSLGDMERAMASLAMDPTVQTVLPEQLEKAGVVLGETKKTAVGVPYATEQRLESALADRPALPRQYVQAILQLAPGGQPKAYDLMGQLADTVESLGTATLATAYETQFGQSGELTGIWILNGGIGDLSYRPGDPFGAGDLSGPLREVAPEESTYYLNPLPYSPLQ